MNAKERLIYALETELENADFSSEQSRDDSYQLFITKTEEICGISTDNSLSIHELVKTINIIDDLTLTLQEAYSSAISYLKENRTKQTVKNLQKAYIVQFDWSTTDASGIELYVYDSYDKAYDRFKQLIRDERNPNNSWVGGIEFDDEGYPTDERYELDFEDNNSGESEVWWHITDRNDWYIHSFIDLLVKEIM